MYVYQRRNEVMNILMIWCLVLFSAVIIIAIIGMTGSIQATSNMKWHIPLFTLCLLNVVTSGIAIYQHYSN